MKILCDQMLGSLAKWLRILGFDTFYTNSDMSDDYLISIALNQKRILITCDKILTIKAKKKNLKVIRIDVTELDQQINTVLNKLNLDKELFFSRCTLCNTVLDKIENNKIEKMVPQRVLENNDKFWFCRKCKKLYWKGTHYNNMIERINEIIKN